MTGAACSHQDVQPEKSNIVWLICLCNPEEDSDLDILVIKEMHIPRHERVREVKNTYKV
jgi:hypothetical protein